MKSVEHYVSMICSPTSHVYSEVSSITKPLAHYPRQLNQPYQKKKKHSEQVEIEKRTIISVIIEFFFITRD